ncbi:MAG: hypothetical protein HY877_00320 [Deltaproteobacteria bacterium]|nr:hypothetical protein [Deltaproteobacteria bacterium]
MKPASKKALQAFKQWGEAGGKKRAKNLSSSKRQSISRHAAEVRWGLQKTGETSMPSVRLKESLWEDAVYLEEVLSHGGLEDWKELRRKIADRPFGAEAVALEKVLNAMDIYGATSLWKGILGHLRGSFS